MLSGEKILEIIQNKANISGECRHWQYFNVSFIEQYVFIVVHEHFLDYAVRIVVFDKPQKWGHGNLQVFQISTHWTLSEAQKKATEMKSRLKNLEHDRRLPIIPITSFLNGKEYQMDNYGYDTVDDDIKRTLYQSTWTHYLMISPGEADDYLKPFDIIKANRSGGFFKHVGIYLGKGYICHFTGDKMGSSGSDGMKVIKDTLRNFLEGNEKSHICVTRPIVRFKNREEMIEGIAKAIASEYGKYKYDIQSNNCEHFANMIALGINDSGQWGAVFKPFTSPYSTILKEEIRECERVISNLASSSNSTVRDLVNEIKDLAQENSQDGWGNWEARIEVNDRPLNNIWCNLQ